VIGVKSEVIWNIDNTSRSRATRYSGLLENANYSKQSFGEFEPTGLKIE